MLYDFEPPSTNLRINPKQDGATKAHFDGIMRKVFHPEERKLNFLCLHKRVLLVLLLAIRLVTERV